MADTERYNIDRPFHPQVSIAPKKGRTIKEFLTSRGANSSVRHVLSAIPVDVKALPTLRWAYQLLARTCDTLVDWPGQVSGALLVREVYDTDAVCNDLKKS